MRKNFGPQTWCFPMPVLIVGTYDKEGKPNAMNAAWGGIYDYNLIMLSLSEGHKTYKNILESGAFTVSFANEESLVACDYVGIASGNKTKDKMAKAGFTTTPSECVNAPIINELPLTLECKLNKVNEDGIIIGDVINVSSDESILDSNGKPDISKMHLISYVSPTHDYVSVGERVVGKAFHSGKALV